MSVPKAPKELDAIADVVLAYRPKPKSKSGKRRKRLAKKLSCATPNIDRTKNEREY
jgi:hypothetical protein